MRIAHRFVAIALLAVAKFDPQPAFAQDAAACDRSCLAAEGMPNGMPSGWR